MNKEPGVVTIAGAPGKPPVNEQKCGCGAWLWEKASLVFCENSMLTGVKSDPSNRISKTELQFNSLHLE